MTISSPSYVTLSGNIVAIEPQDVSLLGTDSVSFTAIVDGYTTTKALDSSPLTLSVEVLPACNFSPITTTRTEQYEIDVVADGAPVT